jgi:hypothetical protein
MKTKQRYLNILLFMLLAISTSCRGDDDPTPQEFAFEKLRGTWDLSQGGSITIDGQDASANFAGFSLSFTESGYATTNAGDLFRASGTWEWLNEVARRFSLDDGKVITIIELTEDRFTFNFTNNSIGGVASGIAGNYIITVNK